MSQRKRMWLLVLSRKPHEASVADVHHELDDMQQQYATDLDFQDVHERLSRGETVPKFSLKDGFLMHGTRLCVTRQLRQKVLTKCHQPPYARHMGIDATVKAIESLLARAIVRECAICKRAKHDRHKIFRIVATSAYTRQTMGKYRYGFCF